jgi:hypothetical protein
VEVDRRRGDADRLGDGAYRDGIRVARLDQQLLGDGEDLVPEPLARAPR